MKRQTSHNSKAPALWATVLCFMCMSAVLHASGKDALLQVLQDEMQRETTARQHLEQPPYYMSFRVDDQQSVYLEASFGVLSEDRQEHFRVFTPMVRVGDWSFDNYHPVEDAEETSSATYLPLDDDAAAIGQTIWLATEEAYRQAERSYATAEAADMVSIGGKNAGDYSPSEPHQYVDAPAKFPLSERDVEKWKQLLRTVTAEGAKHAVLTRCKATLSVKSLRKYFVSSEGGAIVQNQPYITLGIDVMTRAEDGMQLPLFRQWFSFKPENLPDERAMLEAVRELAERLERLRNAPVADPYSGPAMMSAEAAGVLFHEIFGHRMEGQRLKDENDAQTFRHMTGERILPEDVSVTMRPLEKTFRKQDLNGYYLFDDEGAPAEAVELVSNGVLRHFLMSRTPVEGLGATNGHGRAASGYQPVTRQSNLFVTTSAPRSTAALRRMLLEDVKAQGLPYGYYFADVTGGFTQTSRYTPNAFNVTPLEVYRIFPDGRPDELVRGVDLIGTPLAMFSQIEAFGETPEVFTGQCGAESGYVPVTCIAPQMFIRRIETQRQSVTQDIPPVLAVPKPVSANKKDDADAVLQAMQDELQRSADSLRLAGSQKPFLLRYALQQGTLWRTMSVLGSRIYEMEQPVLLTSVNALTGDYERTSTDNAATAAAHGNGYVADPPVEPDYNGIRRQLWYQSDLAYKQAVRQWQSKQTLLRQRQIPEEELAIPDLTPLAPHTFREPLTAGKPDLPAWSRKMANVSRIFRNYPSIYASSAGMEVFEGTHFAATTEQINLQIPFRIAVASVIVSTMTDDGLTISDRLSYYGKAPDELPSEETMKQDAVRMAEQMELLRKAPRIEEHYTGPVLVEGLAAAKYLAQGLFASQGQGIIAYRPGLSQTSDEAATTTEDKLQRRVMPEDMDVTATPFLSAYQGIPLWGAYRTDADGVVPDSAMTIIGNGLLLKMVNGRTPTAHSPRPTGHERLAYNPQRISLRVVPSVVQCTSHAGLTDEALKERFMEAIRKEGYGYGYIIRTIPNGRTDQVYRVDTDGNETLVRAANVSKVTFRNLKDLLGVSGRNTAHNMLWSEVPVSFICPEKVLFEEMDITRENIRKAEQLPSIPGPLSDGQ